MPLVLGKYGKAMKARIAKKSVLWLRTADGSLLCAPLVRGTPTPLAGSSHVLDNLVGVFRAELFMLAAIRGDPDTQPPRIGLIFAGKPLGDNSTLRACGLHVGSEVTLLKMPALLELHVHVIGYIDMIVFVDPTDTINKFKAHIQSSCAAYSRAGAAYSRAGWCTVAVGRSWRVNGHSPTTTS